MMKTHCCVLQCDCYSVLQCVAVCCSVLQCVAVCCSMLQYVAVCCSVLQYVAVCCSMMQCVAACYSVLQCVVVCSSVFQCVAVCCSVLQCVIDRRREHACGCEIELWRYASDPFLLDANGQLVRSSHRAHVGLQRRYRLLEPLRTKRVGTQTSLSHI